MEHDRAIVVGAGVGGLSTAIYLALDGYRVTIFEANDQVGGRANLIEFDGFKFDTGPSLMNYPWVFDELFRSAGTSLDEELDLIKVDPAIMFRWPDGETFQVSSDLHDLSEACRDLDSRDAEGLFKFLEDSQHKYNVSFDRLVSRNSDSVISWFKAAGIRNLTKLGLFRSMESQLRKYFKSKRVVEAFGSYGMYLGGAPTDLPGIFSIIPFGELAHGLWLPKGGMYSLIEAMQRTAERLGVEIRTDCPVKTIETKSNSIVGVTLNDGSFEDSRLVVSNVDVPTTMTRLLGTTGSSKYSAPKMTPGVITYYMAVDRELPELGHHTVFMPQDPNLAYQQLMKNGQVPDDLPFYVSVASNTDRTLAPTGKSAVFMLAPVPRISEMGDISWDRLTASIGERMLTRMRNHGIGITQDEIIKMETMDPVDWSNKFGLFDGSAFGAAHNLRQIGPFRSKNYSSKISGLFFTGASTTPGTGVPMCVLSGKMVANRISQRVRKKTSI